MRRVGQVEDIAASPSTSRAASSWVTGKVFEIDGGVEHPAFTIPFETAVARDRSPDLPSGGMGREWVRWAHAGAHRRTR